MKANFFSIIIFGALIISCERDDLLKKNQYSRYITGKINGKQFLLPPIYIDGSNSNTLHGNNFLRLHYGSNPKEIGTEIIIHDLDLRLLKLPAKIPNKNFTIALQDSSMVLPNNKKCKELKVPCFYVSNDTSTNVELIVTIYDEGIIEGNFSGVFHTHGFRYFVINDLTDKAKVSNGYFTSKFTKFN